MGLFPETENALQTLKIVEKYHGSEKLLRAHCNRFRAVNRNHETGSLIMSPRQPVPQN